MKHLIQQLVSLANKCDESGLYKEAEELDSIATKLAQSLRPMGKPFKEHGVEMQMYVDKDGKTVKKPTHPVDSGPGMLEKSYDYLSEKAQEGMKSMLSGGVGLAGKVQNQPEGAEQFSEWAGFKD
jgi:hypothetical protein